MIINKVKETLGANGGGLWLGMVIYVYLMVFCVEICRDFGEVEESEFLNDFCRVFSLALANNWKLWAIVQYVHFIKGLGRYLVIFDYNIRVLLYLFFGDNLYKNVLIFFLCIYD